MLHTVMTSCLRNLYYGRPKSTTFAGDVCWRSRRLQTPVIKVT